jgi:hypothetical protein
LGISALKSEFRLLRSCIWSSLALPQFDSLGSRYRFGAFSGRAFVRQAMPTYGLYAAMSPPAAWLLAAACSAAATVVSGSASAAVFHGRLCFGTSQAGRSGCCFEIEAAVELE